MIAGRKLTPARTGPDHAWLRLSDPRLALEPRANGSSRSHPAKTTLVLASAIAESRKRWRQRLGDAFTVCEVDDVGALDEVTNGVKPGILVLDLALPRLGRARGLRDIQRSSPSTRTLALTDAPTEAEGIWALKEGARGYYIRTIDPLHLRKAVEAIQKGEIWIERKLVTGLVAELLSLVESREKELPPGLDRRPERLTVRQRVIADLICEGASNKDVARQLNISERTVKAHLTGAFRNVGVSDRLQLALLLTAHGANGSAMRRRHASGSAEPVDDRHAAGRRAAKRTAVLGPRPA